MPPDAKPHYEQTKLVKEYFEIREGECCLPKLCYVDFRTLYRFDDIQLGSRIRSRAVQRKGHLSNDLLKRIHQALVHSKTLERPKKQMVLAVIASALAPE